MYTSFGASTIEFCSLFVDFWRSESVFGCDLSAKIVKFDSVKEGVDNATFKVAFLGFVGLLSSVHFVY